MDKPVQGPWVFSLCVGNITVPLNIFLYHIDNKCDKEILQVFPIIKTAEAETGFTVHGSLCRMESI